MRLNARHFGLSSAVMAAGTFVMCAFVVAFAPNAMQKPLSYVLHVALTQMPRPISAPSFFISLAVFSGFFYVVCAFCIAALYNALQLRDERAATLHAALARG